MNINANELLLLNKKVKFGQDGTKSAETAVVSTPETANPQTGLNALMFQGLKNVASDPQLAGELKVMRDSEPEQNDNKAEYIAPYKSNLAFQGKAGKIKSMAAAAMMGLAVIGSSTALTSCADDPSTYTNVTVNVDLSALQAMIAELKGLREDLNNRDEELAEKYNQLIGMFQQVITLMQEQQLSNETFQALVLANQQLIIDLMVNNGMKQDEANAKLTQILDALAKGQITLQQALEQLKELTTITGDIRDLLNKAIEDFNKYAEATLAKQDELIATNKQGFDELIKRGDITNATLNKITEQNDSLIVLGNQQIEAQTKIKEAIEKANLDSNANFDKVVATLNINKNQLIAVLMKLGYRQEQILKMTAGQIIDAIEDNTAVTKGTNMLLGMITRQLSILPEMLKQQKITNNEIAQLNAKVDALMEEVRNGNMTAEDFYKKALGFMCDNSVNQRVIIYQLVKNGKTEAEANKLLQQLINEVKSGNKTAEDAFNEIQEILGDINTTLGEIKDVLNNLSANFNKFYADYKDDKKTELKLLGSIYRNGKFQSAVLVDLARTQYNMNENIKGIKNNTDQLLEIAKDDTKFKELIQTIKDGQTGSAAGFDYDKLKAMFEQLGLDLKDVINYNSSQLQQAIKDFQNTYIVTEQKQTEELQTIQLKMDDLQIFLSNNQNNKGVIDAINNLNNSVNKGNEDVTNELKVIEAALKQIQDTVDAILKSVGNQASKVDIYFKQWSTKFDTALGLLENYGSQLSTIIANQRVAAATLNNLLTEVKNLKAEVQKLQNMAGGSNFSMEELEEMWQKHDAANYEKYSKLIKDFGFNQGDNIDFTTIEGFLASIDEKMDNITDNSDILNKILNKLGDIADLEKLSQEQRDQIIELLKNFKCNCQCGGNNEGILGDLDNILG